MICYYVSIVAVMLCVFILGILIGKAIYEESISLKELEKYNLNN